LAKSADLARVEAVKMAQEEAKRIGEELITIQKQYESDQLAA
jgi:hypothetical protein